MDRVSGRGQIDRVGEVMDDVSIVGWGFSPAWPGNRAASAWRETSALWPAWRKDPADLRSLWPPPRSDSPLSSASCQTGRDAKQHKVSQTWSQIKHVLISIFIHYLLPHKHVPDRWASRVNIQEVPDVSDDKWRWGGRRNLLLFWTKNSWRLMSSLTGGFSSSALWGKTKPHMTPDTRLMPAGLLLCGSLLPDPWPGGGAGLLHGGHQAGEGICHPTAGAAGVQLGRRQLVQLGVNTWRGDKKSRRQKETKTLQKSSCQSDRSRSGSPHRPLTVAAINFWQIEFFGTSQKIQMRWPLYLWVNINRRTNMFTAWAAFY